MPINCHDALEGALEKRRLLIYTRMPGVSSSVFASLVGSPSVEFRSMPFSLVCETATEK